MTVPSPFFKGAADMAGIPADSFTNFLAALVESTGLVPDHSPDGWQGMVMAALAGAAAAVAVALALTIYFRLRYRTRRDVVRHGFAALAVFALLTFVAYDMRHAALAYLGINPVGPAVEYDMRVPETVKMTTATREIN
jgi:hypothetical protein